jgi:hypothetical protein
MYGWVATAESDHLGVKITLASVALFNLGTAAVRLDVLLFCLQYQSSAETQRVTRTGHGLCDYAVTCSDTPIVRTYSGAVAAGNAFSTPCSHSHLIQSKWATELHRGPQPPHLSILMCGKYSVLPGPDGLAHPVTVQDAGALESLAESSCWLSMD